MSDEQPKFSRGKKMNVPDGTGFGFGFGGESGGITRYLMSGADAQNPENIIKLFEAIKGRKATAEEIANVERKLKAKPADSWKVKAPAPAPSTRKPLPTTQWGRPSSVPPGTGFGLSGITSRSPKKAPKRKELTHGAHSTAAPRHGPT